jgi:hypothetical protein
MGLNRATSYVHLIIIIAHLTQLPKLDLYILDIVHPPGNFPAYYISSSKLGFLVVATMERNLTVMLTPLADIMPIAQGPHSSGA